jgi:hypothetical protein
LTIQDDANFCIAAKGGDKVYTNSAKGQKAARLLQFNRSSDDLELFNANALGPNSKLLWRAGNTKKHESGAYSAFVMQDDGNAVLIVNGAVVWTSKDNLAPKQLPQSLPQPQVQTTGAQALPSQPLGSSTVPQNTGSQNKPTQPQAGSNQPVTPAPPTSGTQTTMTQSGASQPATTAPTISLPQSTTPQTSATGTNPQKPGAQVPDSQPKPPAAQPQAPTSQPNNPTTQPKIPPTEPTKPATLPQKTNPPAQEPSAAPKPDTTQQPTSPALISANGRDNMMIGGCLYAGERLITSDKNYWLELQSDGNLVLSGSGRFLSAQGKVWSTEKICAKNTARLVLSGDWTTRGMLSVIGKQVGSHQESTIWSSGQFNNKAISIVFWLGNEGIPVVTGDGEPIWQVKRTWGWKPTSLTSRGDEE